MTQTPFKIWLQKIWQEHKAEVENFTGQEPHYSMEDYVKKYRWWLKSVYKRQQQNARTF